MARKKKNVVVLEGEEYMLTIPPRHHIDQLTKLYIDPALYQDCLVRSTYVEKDKPPKPVVSLYGQMINTGIYKINTRQKVCWCCQSSQWYVPCLIPMVNGELCSYPPMDADGTIISYGKLFYKMGPIKLSGEQMEIGTDEIDIRDSSDDKGLIQWIWFEGYLHALNCRLWVSDKLYKRL